MTPRTFSVLAVATVVAVGAAAFSVANQDRFASADPGGRFVPGLVERINDVRRLEVVTGQGPMTFERRAGDRWHLLESDGYPARAERIQKAVLGLAELRTFEAKTAKEKWHAKLDLRPPEVEGARGKRVRALDAEGTPLADLIVGRTRYNMPGSTRDGVYVRHSADQQTWLALGELDVGAKPGDWLEHRITDVAEETVKSARFVHPDGQVLVISNGAPEDSRFHLAGIPADKKLKYDNDPNTMAAVLENLDLEDARKDGAVAFDPASTIEAEFITFDGLSVAVSMTEKDGAPWIRVSAVADGAGDKARETAETINGRTSGWIYKIPGYKAARLKKRFEDMLQDRASGS